MRSKLILIKNLTAKLAKYEEKTIGPHLLSCGTGSATGGITKEEELCEKIL